MTSLFNKLFCYRNTEAKVSFTCVDETHGKAIIERDGNRYEVNIQAFSKEKVAEIEEYHRKNLKCAV
jgi:hypothetical protein